MVMYHEASKIVKPKMDYLKVRKFQKLAKDLNSGPIKPSKILAGTGSKARQSSL